MAFLGLLATIAAWVWLVYLPGYFTSRLLIPELRGAARHGVALVCGFSTVPLIVFLLTVAAGIPYDAPLAFITSTAINIGGALAIFPGLRAGDPGASLLGIGARDTAAVAVAALAVGLFLLFGLRSLDGGDVFSTVHHCLYVITMHTIGNDPSSAQPMYDWLSDQSIHYLVAHPTTEFNGLAPLFFEQRLGNAPILASSISVFGTAGWFVVTVTASLVCGVCTWLSARELGAHPASAAIGAVVFVYGMHIFLAYFVNENLYAVALVSFLIWAALRQELSTGWLILLGITCGHLVGVRYTSCLFWPAVALAVLWTRGTWSERMKRFALGAGFAVLFLLPWLYVNYIMLGDPVTHPKVHSEFASRIVNNTLFGMTFEFRALNWPFTDSIVRTAWNPFPSWLWLPLWCGLCFGQLGLALGAVGLWGLRGRRRAFVLLLVFAVPHSLAITLLESLDWEQITYAAPGLAPLGILIALGVDPLLDPARRRRHGLIVVAALVAVTSAAAASALLQFPVDQRILTAEHWPDGQPPDRGVEAVSAALTAPHPLPRMPVFRTRFAQATWRSFAHVFDVRPTELADGVPVYPNKSVAVLAGYASREATSYDFALEGGELRGDDSEVRTSLGLHLVALKLPVERARFQIRRNNGTYQIDVTLLGAASAPRDYSFWLHPWFPPISAVHVISGGKPLPNVRSLTYGGTVEDGEQRFIVTNYGASVLDTRTITYTVDAAGESMHCGLFLFTARVDPTHIETLVLAGGHDQSWYGTTSGTLTIPRNMVADHLVLYNEPYCTDHVPQYGDRYGLVEGPFEGELKFKLDRMWTP